MTVDAPDRLSLAAVRWCSLSVLWSAVAGVSSTVVGAAVSSAALLGFGANSILDGAASAVLICGSAADAHAAVTTLRLSVVPRSP